MVAKELRHRGWLVEITDAGSLNFKNKSTGNVLASIDSSGNLAVDGDITVGDDFTVTDDATVSGDLTVVGSRIGGKVVVEAHTAGDTLTAPEVGSIHTNEGASGAVTLVLPAAVAGMHFEFHVMAAQELRIDPNGTETVALPSTGAQSAAGKYISADAVGEWVAVKCVKAGQWQVMGYLGTWTAES